MPRTGRLLLAAVALAVPAGCGGGSPADAVRATLAGFAKATAQRDYQGLCDTYFAPKLVDEVEQTGLPCEAAIRPEISATQKPTLKVKAVQVHGDSATAQIHTTAANQPPSDDTIALVRVSGKWHISSLATAGPQPSGP